MTPNGWRFSPAKMIGKDSEAGTNSLTVTGIAWLVAANMNGFSIRRSPILACTWEFNGSGRV